MVKPAVGMRDGHGGQGLGDGVLQGLPGPRLGGAQGRLARRPAPLDRRPIGCVGRQLHHLGTRLLTRFTHACRLVRPQVVTFVPWF
jgi:hypothetical protein